MEPLTEVSCSVGFVLIYTTPIQVAALVGMNSAKSTVAFSLPPRIINETYPPSFDAPCAEVTRVHHELRVLRLPAGSINVPFPSTVILGIF